MACFGFPNAGRCPRCGAPRGSRRNALNSRNNAARAAAIPAPPPQPCAAGTLPANTAQENYTGPISAEGSRTCCDPYCGCRVFPADSRSPFWPDFAHPRWLPCDVLYSAPRTR